MKSKSTARALPLSPAGREQLQFIARSQRMPAALARRAQMILRMADGESNSAVARRFGVSRPTVTLWRARFRERGIEGLRNESKPGRPRSTREEQIAGLIVTARGPRPEGGAHWSGRGLAAHAGLSKTTVHRYLSLLGVLPNHSGDVPVGSPGLDRGRAIVGLYLNPPDRVLAVCVDGECALHGPGEAATLSAALQRANASVLPGHLRLPRQRPLLAFLERIEAEVPQPLDIQLLCGYESAPQRSRIRAWLMRRARFQLCCIPSYGAWLTRLERELATCAAQAIVPGFFDALADVKRNVACFIEGYPQHPRPFSWPESPEVSAPAR